MQRPRRSAHARKPSPSLGARIAAFTAGTIAAAGALIVLLDTPLRTCDWSAGPTWSAILSCQWDQKHILVPIMLVIAIFSGKLMYLAQRAGVRSNAVGFGVVFAMATVWIVINSVGNQAESNNQASAGTVHRNAQIARIEDELGRTEKRLARAHAEADRLGAGIPRTDKRGRQRGWIMRPGCGPASKCQAWRQRASELESHVSVLKSRLDTLGPQRTVDAGASHWGRMAEFVGLDARPVKTGVELFPALLLALTLELSAIWGFGFALYAPRTGNRESETVSPLETLDLTDIRQSYRPQETVLREKQEQVRKLFLAETAPAKPVATDHPVLKLIAAHPGICVTELGNRMGCTKGEASKRWKAVSNQVVTVKDGWYLRLYLRDEVCS
ncbi:MAG: hypothetical protein AAFU66_00605 [Pseudomonadota bacterium]